MGSSFSPSDLTPFINISTDAPFPFVDADVTGAGEVTTSSKASDDEKVQLRICSEFIRHTAAVTAFSSSQRVALVIDGQGQPIVASIGDDKRLYMLYYVNGAPETWQMVDMSPARAEEVIVAFDMASWGGKIFIAAAVKLPNGASVLYSTSMKTPVLSFNADTRCVVPDLKGNTRWQRIPNDLGDKVIASVLIAPAAAPLAVTADYQISVGTNETQELAGSHYVIDPSETAKKHWINIPLPETTREVLDVQGARTSNGVGSFILYRRPDGTGCTQEVIDSTGKWSQPLGNIRILTDPIGTVEGMCAHANPGGQTDLFIAGNEGIGFYQSTKLTRRPQIILPEVAFKQVVSAEDLDASNPKQQSTISLFGVSRNNELYHVVGSRKFADNSVTFKASGLPIRKAVQQLSCIYNGKSGTNELVYAVSGSNTLRHLVRDEKASTWNDTAIRVPSIDSINTYPAYVTTISCTNSVGAPVPEGYPITISGPAMTTKINDMSFNIRYQPSIVKADHEGRIEIIMPVDDALGGPTLSIAVSQYLQKPQSFEIHPAQRVLRALSTIKNGNDLTSAKTTKGKYVFPELQSSSDGKEKAESVSKVMSNFTNFVQTADPDVAKQVLDDQGSKADMVVAVEKGEDGRMKITGNDWIDNAISKVVHFFEDAIEWIKGKLKTVFKFAFRILAGALEFVIEIGGKIIKFAIKAIGYLVRTVVTFLKDHLGIDLTGLLEWLGFIFDIDNIKKTQKVINDIVSESLHVATRFLDINRSTLTDGIESLREKLKPIIKDTRPPKGVGANGTGSGIFGEMYSKFDTVVNNPAIKVLTKLSMPFKIVLEAFTESAAEELGELFQFPSMEFMRQALTETVPNMAQDELDNMVRLFADIIDKFKAIFKDPSSMGDRLLELIFDIFWTLFDVAEILIVAVYDIVVLVVKQLFELVTGKIKVPIVTSLFEVIAEQDFSFLNVGSFITATIMNIIFAIKDKKLPFDVLGDPIPIFSIITDDVLDLHSVLGIKKRTIRAMAVAPHAIKIKAAKSETVFTLPETKPTERDKDAERKYKKGTFIAGQVSAWFGLISSSATMVALHAASGTKYIKDPYKKMKSDMEKLGKEGKGDWNMFQAKDLGKIDSKFIGLKATVTFMGSGLSLASKIIELALMRHYMNESPWLWEKYGKANDARTVGCTLNATFMVSGMGVNVLSMIMGQRAQAGAEYLKPLEASTSAFASTLNSVGDIVNLTCGAIAGSGSDEEIARAVMRAVGRDASTLAGTWGSYYAAIEGPNQVTAILAIQGIAVPFLHNLSSTIVDVVNFAK